MQTLERITVNGLPVGLLRSRKDCRMSSIVSVALAVLVFAVVPPGSALEPIVCTVAGSTGIAGTNCQKPGEWDNVEFAVTGVCKDCDGSIWTRESGLRVVRGNCLRDCGAILSCTGCRKQISDNQVSFYTKGVQRSWGMYTGCTESFSQTAEVICGCSACGQSSPILISMTDGRYQLTSPADGVSFDIDGDGTAEQTAWTAAGSGQAFLVLDRNQNGHIDNSRELFGDRSPQFPSDEPNGWRALAVWDDSLNGGNENGKIEAGDYIFSSLQLWIDENHNGFSEAAELFGLGELGLAYLDLDYKKAERRDRFGNTFRYKSKVGTESNRVIIAWDVFFVHE